MTKSNRFNTYVDEQLRVIRLANRREYEYRNELSMRFDTLAYKREIERIAREKTRRLRRERLARDNALASI